VLKGLQWVRVVSWSIVQQRMHSSPCKPRKGCASIVISVGREVGGAIAHRGRSLISTTALFCFVIDYI